MANVDFIEKRLSGAKEKLVKLEKKLERILKAEESNYELNNPYYYSDYDKRSTLRDIEECKKNIEKYENELIITIEKDNSRNVQVIIDFLQAWKDKVYSLYESTIKSALAMYKELRALYPNWMDKNYDEKMANFRELEREYDRKLYGKFESREYTSSRTGRVHKEKVKVESGEWEFLGNYYTPRDIDEGLKKLDRDLTTEMKHKYDFIIERTNKIVGEIVDTNNLRIGANGELNGIIIGTRGKAKVETIGAGGYNTDTIVNVKHGQIFHYRVLVKEVK